MNTNECRSEQARRRPSTVPLVLLLVTVLLPMGAGAAKIRGRVDYVSAGAEFPMAKADVRWCRGKRLGPECQRYQTRADGLFYFDAPAGKYAVSVNGRWFSCSVPSGRARFDCPPFKWRR